MFGRSVDKKDEIRAYIKACSKLGCSLKKLMTELSTAFGPSCVSYDTVQQWKKKFESGVESIKNAPKSGRPKSVSRKEIVAKIKEIIDGDARFTVRDIARKVGISLSTVHLILKKHLKVRKISKGWLGVAKVMGILHHWGVQLILASSRARPAILLAGKGRGGMFLILLFLNLHSCSSFFPGPLFHLLYYLFYIFSPFLWETTQNDPQGLTCR